MAIVLMFIPVAHLCASDIRLATHRRGLGYTEIGNKRAFCRYRPKEVRCKALELVSLQKYSEWEPVSHRVPEGEVAQFIVPVAEEFCIVRKDGKIFCKKWDDVAPKTNLTSFEKWAKSLEPVKDVTQFNDEVCLISGEKIHCAHPKDWQSPDLIESGLFRFQADKAQVGVPVHLSLISGNEVCATYSGGFLECHHDGLYYRKEIWHFLAPVPLGLINSPIPFFGNCFRVSGNEVSCYMPDLDSAEESLLAKTWPYLYEMQAKEVRVTYSSPQKSFIGDLAFEDGGAINVIPPGYPTGGMGGNLLFHGSVQGKLSAYPAVLAPIDNNEAFSFYGMDFMVYDEANDKVRTYRVSGDQYKLYGGTDISFQ